jgi:hypothetical protein
MDSRHSPTQAPTTLNDLQQRVALAIFDRLDHAESAARDLRTAGVPDDDVSFVYKRPGSLPELGAEETHTGNGTVAGATTGALLGGALGLVALAIPGIGPLLAAGPIVAAISGALAGGTLGGLIGSFVGLGVPKEQAQAYEEAVRNGGIVLAVRLTDPATNDRVLEILRQHQAKGVASFTPAL